MADKQWNMECEEMDRNMVFGHELWGEFMIDLDFEFDAPKYVDLSKEESVMQAPSAEKWFDTAKSDPPSPAVTKKLRQLGLVSEDDANNKSKKLTNGDENSFSKWAFSSNQSNAAIQGNQIVKACSNSQGLDAFSKNN